MSNPHFQSDPVLASHLASSVIPTHPMNRRDDDRAKVCVT
jgi:hypothetical protein